MRRTHQLERAMAPLAIMLALALGACGDEGTNVVPIISNVQTFHDSTFDFSALATFAMPDTVVQFAPLTGTPLPVSRQFDSTMLDRVAADFTARGYTQVAPGAKPDFIVLIGTTATTNYNAWVSYPWFTVWGFWPGWSFYAPGFDSSWIIVYPWGPTVGVTAYPRGTMVVTLIPTTTVNPTGKSITAKWAGVATALLTGSITSLTIDNAVDEMFAQSPYLVAGGSVAARRSGGSPSVRR